MYISEEKVFKACYMPTKKNILKKQGKWTSRIIRFVYNNKILCTAGTIFVMCLILNLILIFNFMKILISAY